MARKKGFALILLGITAVVLYLLIVVYSYNTAAREIRSSLQSTMDSVNNVEQMGSLLFSQTLLIPQYLSDLDASPNYAFQSYATEFQKYYQLELDKASTQEEINYVFDIFSSYNINRTCKFSVWNNFSKY